MKNTYSIITIAVTLIAVKREVAAKLKTKGVRVFRGANVNSSDNKSLYEKQSVRSK